MRRILNKLLISIAIFLFYIISIGTLKMYTIFFGIIISIAIAIIVDKMLIISKTIELRDAIKIVYILKYLLYFIYSEIKSHIYVTKMIFMNNRIRPAIIAIPYTTETDYGITLLALSITNTPGTLTLHVDKAAKTMYIHWIDASTLDVSKARKIISEKFDELAKKIFG